jgi:hypothetical protein
VGAPNRDCSAIRQKKLDVRCIRAGLSATDRHVLAALLSWADHKTGIAYP